MYVLRARRSLDDEGYGVREGVSATGPSVGRIDRFQYNGHLHKAGKERPVRVLIRLGGQANPLGQVTLTLDPERWFRGKKSDVLPFSFT